MTDKAAGGLLESLTNFMATLVAIAHTRLDLLSTDLEEDREHLFALLKLTLTAMFCFGLGALLVVLLLVAVFWDTHRLLVLGALIGFFLTAGLVAWAYARQKARTMPRLFAATLAELLKDRQQLDPKRS